MLEKIKSEVKKIRLYRVYKHFSKKIKNIFSRIEEINVTHWPLDINIELTTKCNAKCESCTHESLIWSKDRPLKNMDFESSKKIIDRLREMTVLRKIPQNLISISPVGLGEPLMNPDFFKILKYIRDVFPLSVLKLNTNGILLNEENSKKLIESGLDEVIISLGYSNSEDYEKYMGIKKYDVVLANIKNLLQLKGEQKPSVRIHNFDVPENRDNFSEFYKYWSPFINSNDNVILYPYKEIRKFKQQKDSKYPCYQLWNVIMIDVDGNVFPCCLGVWKKYDDNLRLGHIIDDFKQIYDKLNLIRFRHLNGNFGTCSSCAVLYSEEGINRRIVKSLKRNNLFNSQKPSKF